MERAPRFGKDLRHKALLAVEEACHDSRYRKVPQTYLLRFALAYLWTLSDGDREPFVAFWRAIVRDNDLFRFSTADRELGRIYQAVGAKRDDADYFAAWRVAQTEHEKRRNAR